MKHGIIWFLHLNRVIFGAKIAVIPLAIAGVLVRLLSPIFFVIWALWLLSAITAGASFLLHTPSDGAMEHFILTTEREFCDRQQKEFAQRHNHVQVLYLRSYAKDEKVKIGRMLHGREIYGVLVMLAVVSARDGRWLVRETQTLYADQPRQTAVFRMDETSVAKKYPAAAGNVSLVVKVGEIVADVYAYEDYHVTDFIQAVGPGQKPASGLPGGN